MHYGMDLKFRLHMWFLGPSSLGPQTVCLTDAVTHNHHNLALAKLPKTLRAFFLCQKIAMQTQHVQSSHFTQVFYNSS